MCLKKIDSIMEGVSSANYNGDAFPPSFDLFLDDGLDAAFGSDILFVNPDDNMGVNGEVVVESSVTVPAAPPPSPAAAMFNNNNSINGSISSSSTSSNLTNIDNVSSILAPSLSPLQQQQQQHQQTVLAGKGVSLKKTNKKMENQ